MMSFDLTGVFYILYTVFLPPFLCVLGAVLFLASFGKSLGIRRMYVRWLLKVFKAVTKMADEAKQQRLQESKSSEKLVDFKLGSPEDDDRSSKESSPVLTGSNGLPKKKKSTEELLKNNSELNGDAAEGEDGEVVAEANVDDEDDEVEVRNRRNKLKKYGKESRHNVISRKDNLVLTPDKPPKIQEELDQEELYRADPDTPTPEGGDGQQQMGTGMPEKSNVTKMSANTLRKEFHLESVLDYIKTGIGSIIEDEVTQRFVAEELKMWNLLTRTSQKFEFVNTKLTVIWIIGFIVRYCILLPGRMCILVVGLTFLMVLSTLLSVFPKSRLKDIIYSWAALTCFRILSRSFSGVIQFHNKHLRPKSDGICVANHTTPIDVVVLSCDRSYALLLWMAMGMAFVGTFPDGEFKRWLHYQVYTVSFQILGGVLSAVITYHNPENKPSQSGICVANHTSPIDVLVLACDNAYALIGQTHSGLLGSFQSMLSKASAHIWFQRSEAKDRILVAKRLKDHVEDPNKLPILIFPEGTCINNTSVMQFKKGSFEVGGTIYPVAIKYDPIFGDAFWNSNQNGMASYIFLMMTSWAIVCDVWYLPPMTRGEGEDAIDFANRVKHEIAQQGGLVDLMWDGNLKRNAVKSEWKEKQQAEFSKSLKVD